QTGAFGVQFGRNRVHFSLIWRCSSLFLYMLMLSTKGSGTHEHNFRPKHSKIIRGQTGIKRCLIRYSKRRDFWFPGAEWFRQNDPAENFDCTTGSDKRECNRAGQAGPTDAKNRSKTTLRHFDR